MQIVVKVEEVAVNIKEFLHSHQRLPMFLQIRLRVSVISVLVKFQPSRVVSIGQKNSKKLKIFTFIAKKFTFGLRITFIDLLETKILGNLRIVLDFGRLDEGRAKNDLVLANQTQLAHKCSENGLKLLDLRKFLNIIVKNDDFGLKKLHYFHDCVE